MTLSASMRYQMIQMLSAVLQSHEIATGYSLYAGLRHLCIFGPTEAPRATPYPFAVTLSADFRGLATSAAHSGSLGDCPPSAGMRPREEASFLRRSRFTAFRIRWPEDNERVQMPPVPISESRTAADCVLRRAQPARECASRATLQAIIPVG
jgi:hypothetical protein